MTAVRVPSPFRSHLAYPLAVACLVAACGGGDLSLPNGGDEGDIAIRVVEGDNQRGSVGEALEAPVVVEVTDDQGDPVEGATVTFALTSAGEGAGIAPQSALTNADGRAEAQVLLGDKVGVQTGEARVAGEGATLQTATFSALAEAADNRSPTADFTWTCDRLTCQFTDASHDSDGSLTAWTWRFGDGTTSEEREPSHTYDRSGTFTVRLTVADDGGANDESSDDVTVTSPSEFPSNQPPQAQFDISCQDLRCTFTDRSEDDGSIESWHWDFGDGGTSSQRNPTHGYDSEGRYDVVLTVTDDEGADDSRTRTAEPEEPAPPPPPPPPPPGNDPPNAEFEVDCQGLRCTFVDRSTDGDGSVVSWQWNFGDGATSNERNPTHDYAEGGRHEVLLMVTDDDGAADTRTHTADPQASPPPEPNREPDADYDVRCQHLVCAFTDKSKDEDGVLVSRHWDFGDGSTSAEQNPVHTYAERGRYETVLTVTDDDGATDSKDRRVDPKP
ncbi:MAG TPA: PKD domain-containing protein [Gemmatimonadales bacterium]